MPDEQLDIFGNAIPLAELGGREVRRDSPDTSREAASIRDQPHHYMALLAVLDLGDRIDATLQRMLPDVHPGTVSKRRLRLERGGYVEATDQRQRTPHGVSAIVYRITDAGREVLREWERWL